MPEIFGPSNSLDLLELPANEAAATAYPTPSVVSSTVWSSSPAGQSNADSLIPSLPDGTTAQRATAAAASRLPGPQRVSPPTGSHTGGTAVTISGWGFTAATGVEFGPNPGTGFSVVNDTTIDVTTPAGTVGPVNVVVVSPAGSGSLSGYSYT